jgi:hypothetical protein
MFQGSPYRYPLQYGWAGIYSLPCDMLEVPSHDLVLNLPSHRVGWFIFQCSAQAFLLPHSCYSLVNMAWSMPYCGILTSASPCYTAAKGSEAKRTIVDETAQAIKDAHKASETSQSLPHDVPQVCLPHTLTMYHILNVSTLCYRKCTIDSRTTRKTQRMVRIPTMKQMTTLSLQEITSLERYTRPAMQLPSSTAKSSIRSWQVK